LRTPAGHTASVCALGSTARSGSGSFKPVFAKGVLLRFWLPVIVWMTIIFSGSTDLLSDRRTSRFLGPFLHWLVPGISDQTVQSIQHGIRKCGHLTEFAILGMLVWRALRQPRRNDRRPWIWSHAVGALAICALYAASDEIHQHFVSTRYSSVIDVAIDTAGAFLGIAAVWLIGRWRRWWG